MLGQYSGGELSCAIAGNNMVAVIHLILVETLIKGLDMAGFSHKAGRSEGSSNNCFMDLFMNKLASNKREDPMKGPWKADFLISIGIASSSECFDGEGVEFGIDLKSNCFQNSHIGNPSRRREVEGDAPDRWIIERSLATDCDKRGASSSNSINPAQAGQFSGRLAKELRRPEPSSNALHLLPL